MKFTVYTVETFGAVYEVEAESEEEAVEAIKKCDFKPWAWYPVETTSVARDDFQVIDITMEELNA